MSRPGRPRKHDTRADDIRKAIRYPTPAEAIALIEQTDVNILDGDAMTPLMHAVLEGKQQIVAWLLSNGADINHQDRNGWSALHCAIQEKQVGLARSLLDHGASVDLKDSYGNTPLWKAVFDSRGEYELVRLLLSHGANPQSKNTSDRSPLDFASQIADEDLIRILNTG
jgi:ankyrin repeat protein